MSAGRLELPRALRSWAPLLAELPAPVAAVIVPWLAAAERLLSPYLAPRAAQAGPPDGFGALSRRGPYERLLLSEWLLWQELPDEFMRRAAGGEHLFQAVIRRQPAGRRQAVVLFDVGPAQVGAPRLAQVALLAVFARRAAAGGSALAWGALQHPGQGLLTRLGAAELATFLGWRTEEPASEEQWRAWRSNDGDDTDVWTVGAPGLRLPGGRFHVEIREPRAPGEGALSVRVSSAGSFSPAVSLALPPPMARVAVLRGAWDAPPGAASAAANSVALLDSAAVAFARAGRRLLLRRDERTVEAWWLPSRPGVESPTCRAHMLPPGESFLAAGWQKRRLVVVSADGRGVTVRGILRKRGDESAVHFPGAAGARLGTETLLPTAWIEPQLGAVWLVITDRHLVRLEMATGLSALVADRVLAAVESKGGMVFLSQRASNLAAMIALPHGLEHFATLPPCTGGPVFAAEPPANARSSVLFAYPGGPSMWRLAAGKGWDVELHPPAGAAVFGAAWLRDRPALLMLESDERTLVLFARDHLHILHVAREPVLFAAIHPQGTDVVVVTATSVLVIDRGARVLLELSRSAGARP